MSFGVDTAKCPYCKEVVKPGATKCKHCSSEIKPVKKPMVAWLARYQNFRSGFVAGILLSAILATIILLYLYTDL